MSQPINANEYDYKLLKKQKQELLELIWEMPNSSLWGIVEMLDTILDEQEN